MIIHLKLMVRQPAKSLLSWLILMLFTIPVFPQMQPSDTTKTTNGTDPAEPHSRFDAHLSRIEPLAAGYILQMAGSGNWAFTDWGSIGFTFPMVYADFPSTVTFEVGDIQLNTLLAFYRNKGHGTFKRAAIGLDAWLNTGDVETGTGYGQHIVAPFLAASFYPADEIMITPVVEEFISLDKDPEGRQRNDLSLRINNTFTIEELWIALIPELIIDLQGDVDNLWVLRTSIGYMINATTGFSAEYISHIAGEKRFNYLGRISMRYLIP